MRRLRRAVKRKTTGMSGKVIGFCGWAGCGKDTAADLMAKMLPGPVLRYSFAEPIKIMARQMGWMGDKDAKGRQLLVDLGMAGRRFDEDCWLREAQDRFYRNTHCSHFVLSDVRFRNEAEWVMREGILVRVVRNGVRPLTCSTEHELDGFPVSCAVANNGNLDDLHDMLYEEVMQRLYG